MVLLYGINPILADQVGRHLVRRDLKVRHAPLGPLDASTVRPGEAFDMVVVDLDLAEPELCQHAVSLRTTFPYVPLVLLSHVRPRARKLDQLHPCAYIRKEAPDCRGSLGGPDDVKLNRTPSAAGAMEETRLHD